MPVAEIFAAGSPRPRLLRKVRSANLQRFRNERDPTFQGQVKRFFLTASVRRDAPDGAVEYEKSEQIAPHRWRFDPSAT